MAKNAISSNTDMVEIIKSTTDVIPRYTDMVKAVIQSISVIEKSGSNLKKFSKFKIMEITNFVDFYLSHIYGVLGTFMQKGRLNMDIEKLLQFFQDEGPSTQIDKNSVKSTGYILIDATVQMAHLITEIVKSIESISGSKTLFINARLRLTIWSKWIRGYIKRIMSLFVQTLTEVDVVDLNKLTDKNGGLNFVKTLTNTLNDVIESIDKLKWTPGKVVELSLTKRVVKKLFKLIDSIIDQCNSLSKNTLSDSQSNKLIIKLNSIQKIVNTLGILAGSLLLISPLLATVALISPALVMSVNVMVWVIKSILTSVKGLANKKTTKGLSNVFVVLGLIGVLAGSLLVLSLISMNVVKNLPWVLLLMLGILSLVGVIWLIAKVSKGLAKASVWEGLLSLIALMGTVLLLGTAMLALTFIAQQVVKGIGNILLMILGILGITVLLVGIGFLAASLSPVMLFALSGMVLIGVLVLSLVAVAAMLKLLEVITLDKDKITNNVSVVMDTAKTVIESLFTALVGDPQESKTPWYEKVLGFIGGTVGTLIKAILAVAILATTVVSVFLITFIATQLRILQTLDLQSDQIKTNVKTVIDTARSIISLLFAPDDTESQPSKKGFFRSIIETLGGGPILNIIDAIMGVAFLATSLVSITLISFIAGELRLLQTLDLQPDQIKSNVKTVIDTAKSIVSQIMAPDDTQPQPKEGIFKKLLNWVMPAAADLIDAISSMGFLTVIMTSVGMITKIAKNLDTIQKIEDLSGVSTKVETVLTSAKTILSSLAGFDAGTKVNLESVSDKLKVLHDMNDIIKEFGRVDNSKLTNGQKVLTGYENFLTKVNDTDLQKLETAKNLVEQMAEFSASIRGNFQGLADSLNEKIAPLLQELQTLMKDTQHTINEGVSSMASTASSMEASSAATASSGDAQIKSLDLKLGQQIRQGNQLMSKIDDLVDLFKNGKAKVATR